MSKQTMDEPQDTFPKGYQLVEYDSTHDSNLSRNLGNNPSFFILLSDLVINQEGIQQLRNWKRPISVVSILGPYLTGKSFLMDRIISDAIGSDGFPVGSTIQTCTKVRKTSNAAIVLIFK